MPFLELIIFSKLLASSNPFFIQTFHLSLPSQSLSLSISLSHSLSFSLPFSLSLLSLFSFSRPLSLSFYLSIFLFLSLPSLFRHISLPSPLCLVACLPRCVFDYVLCPNLSSSKVRAIVIPPDPLAY